MLCSNRQVLISFAKLQIIPEFSLRGESAVPALGKDVFCFSSSDIVCRARSDVQETMEAQNGAFK